MIDMQEAQRRLMKEAIKAFDQIINSREIVQAKAAWEDVVKTHDGQKLLFDEARAGNLDAINYLYYRMQPQIMSVFWSNFLGPNGRMRRIRIERGDQYDFLFYVYQALLVSYYRHLPAEEGIEVLRRNIAKAGRKMPSDEELQVELDSIVEEISQLDSFDYEKYDENTDIINKFGMYIIAVLKNKSNVFNREERLGGVVIPKETKKDIARGGKIGTVSYEAHFENDEATTTGDDFISTVDADVWEHFTRDEGLDEGRDPTARTVLKAFLLLGTKFNVDKVAEDLEVTRMTIRNRLASMGEILERNDVDRATFDRLLTTPGGAALARLL